MAKKKTDNSAMLLAELAVQGIQEKKGNHIVRLDLRKVGSALTDFFVICNADSGTQVKAICDSVEEEIYKKTQLSPWRKEGFEHAEWIILDYSDVVVHVFKTEKRTFYGLEDLWGDADAEHYQMTH